MTPSEATGEQHLCNPVRALVKLGECQASVTKDDSRGIGASNCLPLHKQVDGSWNNFGSARASPGVSRWFSVCGYPMAPSPPADAQNSDMHAPEPGTSPVVS